MARRKKRKKIVVNIVEARKFLFEAYGLKSQLVNHYHLKIVHEEYYGLFHWYFTTGSLVVQIKDKNGDSIQQGLGVYTTDEDVAIKILDRVYKDFKQGKNYWVKKPKIAFSPPTLSSIKQRITKIA